MTVKKKSKHFWLGKQRMRITRQNAHQKTVIVIHTAKLPNGWLGSEMKARGLTVALVGISLSSHEQLDEKLAQIGSLPRVNWCAVVTGRYDILVEVVVTEDIADLYNFLDQALSGVGGIASSESFVVMKARRKWIPLPKGARTWFCE